MFIVSIKGMERKSEINEPQKRNDIISVLQDSLQDIDSDIDSDNDILKSIIYIIKSIVEVEVKCQETENIEEEEDIKEIKHIKLLLYNYIDNEIKNSFNFSLGDNEKKHLLKLIKNLFNSDLHYYAKKNLLEIIFKNKKILYELEEELSDIIKSLFIECENHNEIEYLFEKIVI